MSRSFWKEPLLHFAVVGAVLFGLSALRGETAERPQRITITETQRADLDAIFVQTWNRAPNADERASMLDDFIREEIYVREATRLGLDANDPVIRRRLVQKMEVLARGIAEREPTDTELDNYLAEHVDRYQGQPLITFEQVLVADLSNTADPYANALPSPLPNRLSAVSLRQIAGRFAPDFATELAELPVSKDWTPLTSPLGNHLVRVEAIRPPKPATVERLRARLTADWKSDQMGASETRAFETLKDNYDIRIEE